MAELLYPKASEWSLRGWAMKIRAKLSGGQVSDDNAYPLRLIENEIKNSYALAQKQEDEIKEAQGVLPSDQRLVPFPCIPLKDSSDFTCKCSGSGGSFKVAALPKFIQWQSKSFISYLGNTDMDLPFFQFGSIQQMNAQLDFLDRPGYFLSGSNAYIGLPKKYKMICEITVLGIPEDPTDADGPLCYDVWAEDWQVSNYMRAIVEGMVIQNLAQSLVATFPSRDQRNNSSPGNEFTTIYTP